MGTEWSIPGFGWASRSSARSVSLDERGFELCVDDEANKAKLKKILDGHLDDDLFDQVLSKLKDGVTSKDYKEIISTGCSCGKQLRIDRMYIQSNLSFSLHEIGRAHV